MQPLQHEDVVEDIVFPTHGKPYSLLMSYHSLTHSHVGYEIRYQCEL